MEKAEDNQMREPKWSLDEALLLVDAFLSMKQPRTCQGFQEKAAQLSSFLRDKAVSEGKSISNRFRNVNGIFLKLQNIEYIDSCGKDGMRNYSRNDMEAYRLHTSNPLLFNRKVNELKNKIR